MTEYVAGLCHMHETELVPFETLNIIADDDEVAVKKAVEWRISTITDTNTDRRTWLQVLRNGAAIYSKEIGRFAS